MSDAKAAQLKQAQANQLKNLHREFWGFKPLRNPETA